MVSTDSLDNSGNSVQSILDLVDASIRKSKNRSSAPSSDRLSLATSAELPTDTYLKLVNITTTNYRPLMKLEKKSEDIEPIIQWLKSDTSVLPVDIPCLEAAKRDGIAGLMPLTDEQRAANLLVAYEQKQRFCEKIGWNEQQWQAAKHALIKVISLCEQYAQGAPLEIIWSKIQEAGMLVDVPLNLVAKLMFSLLPNQWRKDAKYAHLVGSSILDFPPKGKNDSVSGNNNQGDSAHSAFEEVFVAHYILRDPAVIINMHVKWLVAHGYAKEAELVIDAAPAEQINPIVHKLLLFLYLEMRYISSALQYFHKMKAKPNLEIDRETYIQLIYFLARNHYLCWNAQPIPGTKYGAGAKLFDDLVSEMSKDFGDIKLTDAKRLYDGFATGFPGGGLHDTTSFAPLQPDYRLAADSDLIVSRVTIDTTTGTCPRSGVTLRSIELQEDDRERLKEGALKLATKSQGMLEKSGVVVTSRADLSLTGFLEYLNEREGEPLTAIVDGANVGYHGQNHGNGRFSFHQIMFVVEKLESVGERPLVVLPEKYMRPYFLSSVGDFRQRQSDDERHVRDKLMESGKMYLVARGCTDDLYWILSSIAEQTASAKGESLEVKPDDPQGRWPGPRPLLISNDVMRDHKDDLLDPRLFERWYRKFVVKYSFPCFVGDEKEGREIIFELPDLFSREIQSNECSDGSVAWHFPLQGTVDDWLCIRIPKSP